MNLIPNKSDPVKPTHKVIKQEDLVVSKVAPAKEPQDSLQQDRHAPTEHLIDFIEKRKKHIAEKNRQMAKSFKKIIVTLNTDFEKQKGVALNVKA